MSTTLPFTNAPLDGAAAPEASGMPVLQMGAKRKLPSGVASNVKQHVILLFDVSSSMSGGKIAESNLAREALLQELASPDNKDGFRVTITDFNTQATRLATTAPAASLNIPASQAGGGTIFDAAIVDGLDAIRVFKNQPNIEGWHYLRPVVLMMSDGQSSIDHALLAELHEEAEVIAIAFGSDADQQALSQLASDGQVQVVGSSGGQLRAFLAQVGQTMSQGLQNSQI